jgi:hypothetical protein
LTTQRSTQAVLPPPGSASPAVESWMPWPISSTPLPTLARYAIMI